jgi:hypothetical protein
VIEKIANHSENSKPVIKTVLGAKLVVSARSEQGLESLVDRQRLSPLM